MTRMVVIDGRLAVELVVGPADHQEDEPAPDSEAGHQEQRRAQKALADGPDVDAAVQGEAEGDRNDHPADCVVDDRGRDDDLPDIAAQEVHLAHHHGDDLHGRDGQSRPEKERRDQAKLRARQHLLREQLAQKKAERKRHGDAGNRYAQRGAANLPYEAEIRFHAGEKQEQEDAELRDGVEHRLLVGARREDGLLELGPDCAENGRPEQDAGQELAHDTGLPDPVHRLPEQAPDDEEGDDLNKEDDFGRARAPAGLGRKGRGRPECDKGRDGAEAQRGPEKGRAHHRSTGSGD